MTKILVPLGAKSLYFKRKNKIFHEAVFCLVGRGNQLRYPHKYTKLRAAQKRTPLKTYTGRISTKAMDCHHVTTCHWLVWGWGSTPQCHTDSHFFLLTMVACPWCLCSAPPCFLWIRQSVSPCDPLLCTPASPKRWMNDYEIKSSSNQNSKTSLRTQRKGSPSHDQLMRGSGGGGGLARVSEVEEWGGGSTITTTTTARTWLQKAAPTYSLAHPKQRSVPSICINTFPEGSIWTYHRWPEWRPAEFDPNYLSFGNVRICKRHVTNRQHAACKKYVTE